MNNNRSSILKIIALVTLAGALGLAVYFVKLKGTNGQIDGCFPGLAQQTLNTPSAKTQYFPSGVLASNEWQDQKTLTWYASYLKSMGEPSLYVASHSVEENYRFLWLRSFHRPVAIRLFRSGGRPSLTVKVLDGVGGHEPGNLVLDKTKSVSESEWQNFVDLLKQQCYWRLTGEDTKDPGGQDGAQWILEGVRERRYHVIDRWSPESGDYREICLYLLKLSGIDVERIY